MTHLSLSQQVSDKVVSLHPHFSVSLWTESCRARSAVVSRGCRLGKKDSRIWISRRWESSQGFSVHWLGILRVWGFISCRGPGLNHSEQKFMEDPRVPPHRYNMKPNWRLLEEASMENISTLILRRQLSMFGHVARLPASDPVDRTISCPDPPEFTDFTCDLTDFI